MSVSALMSNLRLHSLKQILTCREDFPTVLEQKGVCVSVDCVFLRTICENAYVV